MASYKRKPTLTGGSYFGKPKVGKKSKSGDPKCSEAMSKWKSTGHQDKDVAKILGECRARAGKLNTLNKTPGKTQTNINKRERIDHAAEREKIVEQHKETQEHKFKSGKEREQHIEHIAKAGLEKGEQEFKVKSTSKYANKNVVGKAERAAADEAEKHIAKILGGKRLTGYEAEDVIYEIKGRDGRKHLIEVKSKLTGTDQDLQTHYHSVHRKALRARADGHEFHTVVVDLRDKHLGGKFKEHFSGNRYYYGRGLKKKMALSKFQKMPNPENELHDLINSREDQLIPSIRNSFHSLTQEQMGDLEAKAIDSKARHKKRQNEYAERLAELGLTRHGGKITPRSQTSS